MQNTDYNKHKTDTWWQTCVSWFYWSMQTVLFVLAKIIQYLNYINRMSQFVNAFVSTIINVLPSFLLKYCSIIYFLQSIAHGFKIHYTLNNTAEFNQLIKPDTTGDLLNVIINLLIVVILLLSTLSGLQHFAALLELSVSILALASAIISFNYDVKHTKETAWQNAGMPKENTSFYSQLKYIFSTNSIANTSYDVIYKRYAVYYTLEYYALVFSCVALLCIILPTVICGSTVILAGILGKVLYSATLLSEITRYAKFLYCALNVPAILLYTLEFCCKIAALRNDLFSSNTHEPEYTGNPALNAL